MSLALPVSEKITLAAGVAKVVAGQNNGTITVHIKAGTTANIHTTCSTAAEVDEDTADWVEWPNSDTAGPFMDVLIGQVTAIKLTSTAGGVVYLCRSN